MNLANTLTRTGILTVALTLALLANYVYAAWTGPGSNPPTGNVAAPINEGPKAQDKEGRLTVAEFDVLNTGMSAVSLLSTSDRSWRIRTAGTVASGNSVFYVQGDRNNDNKFTTAADGNSSVSPLVLFVGSNVSGSDDYLRTSGQVRSPLYCDKSGNNCFEASEVGDVVDLDDAQMSIVRYRDTGTFAGVGAGTRTRTLSCPPNFVLYNGNPTISTTANCTSNTYVCQGQDECGIVTSNQCEYSFAPADDLNSVSVSVKNTGPTRNYVARYDCLGEVAVTKANINAGEYYFSRKQAAAAVCSKQGVVGRCDALYNNNPTRVQACAVLRPGSTVASYSGSSFSSPGDNSVVRYSGGAWQRLPAKGNNQRVDWIVCKNT